MRDAVLSRSGDSAYPGVVPPGAFPSEGESCSPAPAIVVKRIVVKRDRLVCDVRVAPGAPQTVTPRLARAVRQQFPQLEGHACVNEAGETFGAVLDRASLPHLLEHLAIQLQAEAWEDATCAAPPAASDSSYAGGRTEAQRPGTFVGVTEWTDRQQGTARIQLSFRDDVIALKALRDATAFVNDSL